MIENPITSNSAQIHRGSGIFNISNPEMKLNAKEVYTKAFAAGLILVGLAIVMDGSVNNSKVESLAGGVLLGIGLYNLLHKNS